MSIRHQYRVAVSVALAAAVVACGDLARTNPLDPAFQISVTVSGPTTINSLGATVTYDAVTEPAWDSRAAEWTSSNPAVLRHDGSNRFTSIRAGTSTVIVRLGPHEARMDVTVTQLPAFVEVGTCTGAAAAFTALQQRMDLCSTVRDSSGTVFPQQGVTYASSDQSVLQIENGRAVAQANGSAWVIATFGTLRDSLLFTVEQQPASVRILAGDPPVVTTSLLVPGGGGTFQLGAVVRDANGFPIAGVAPEWSSSAPTVIDVDQSGLVIAPGWGRATITARVGTHVASASARTTGGTPPEVRDFFVGFISRSQQPQVKEWVLLGEVHDAQPDASELWIRVSGTVDWGAVGPLQGGMPLAPERASQPVLITVGVVGEPSAIAAEAWAFDIAGNEGPHVAATAAIGANANAPTATSVTVTRLSADSVQVDFQATDAQLDARDAWIRVNRMDAADSFVRHVLPPQTSATFSGSIRVHLPVDDSAAIEFLLRDAAGGLSEFYVR
jgi:hypothetical protein